MSDDHDRRVDEAIAEYLAGCGNGLLPDRAAFLAKYADLAESLREFLDNKARMRRVAGSPLDPDATLPPPVNPNSDTVGQVLEGNPNVTRTLQHTPTPTVEPLVSMKYFGDYELLAEIARGGMGVVFRARQVSLNREVALKMILTGQLASAADVARFQAEAEAAAKLEHPNILPIYEVGEHLGQQYFAMKLVPGGSLAAKVAEMVKDPKAVMVVFAKVCRAVDFAHRRGILHRDLKPGNILLDADGTPYVTDFGLAKKMEGDSNLTQSGAIVGTPSYMAPEQARAEKGLTISVDVYALGAILYEMLTGQPPFRGPSVLDTILQVLEKDAADPRSVNPNADRDLSVIALKCLHKDPAKRFESAAGLADDLDRWLRNEPIAARPATRRERAWKWIRRNPAVAGLAAGLLLVTAIAFAGITWGLVRAENRGKELAKSNEDLAKAEGESKRRAEEAEIQGYLSDVNLAQQLGKSNDLAGMRLALDRCPAPLRKWEWHYLDQLAQVTMENFIPDSVPVAMEYSPDGKHFAFVTLKGNLIVRDRASGDVRYRIENPEKSDRPVATLAIRPDSAELAVAIDNHLRVVDLKTGSQRFLQQPPDRSKPLVLTPRFNYAVLSYDPSGRLWGAAHRIVNEFKDGIETRHHQFLIRDIIADKTIATIPAYSETAGFYVNAVSAAFSPDGARFAIGAAASLTGARNKDPKFNAASEDAQAAFKPVVTVWELPSGKKLLQFPYAGGALQELRFGPHGELAFGVGRQLNIVVADPKNPSMSSCPAANDNLIAVAFQGKDRIWAGGDDRLLRAYDPITHAELFALPGCPYGIYRIAVAPDGKEVTAAALNLLTRESSICRFNVTGFGGNDWRFGGGDNVASGSLSSDARYAAEFVQSTLDPKNAHLTMRDLDARKGVAFKAPQQFFGGLCLPNGGFAHVSRNNIHLLDAKGEPDGDLVLPESELREGPPALTITSDGGTLAAALDGYRRIKPKVNLDTSKTPIVESELQLVSWDLKTRKRGPILRTGLEGIFTELEKGQVVSGAPMACAVHPNNHLVAVVALVGARDEHGKEGILIRGLLVVWDLQTGQEVFRDVFFEPLRAVAWDPHGWVVVAGGLESGGVVVARNHITHEMPYRLRGHSRFIMGLAFDPEGRLATAGADRVVKLWDTATGREVLTLDGFAQEVTQVAFTRDGANLVAATGRDIVRMQSGGGRQNVWPHGEVRVFRGAPSR